MQVRGSQVNRSEGRIRSDQDEIKKCRVKRSEGRGNGRVLMEVRAKKCKNKEVEREGTGKVLKATEMTEGNIRLGNVRKLKHSEW